MRRGGAWTAAMIGSQSAPGCRVTVTKSFTPNTDATPPAANTSRANGIDAALSASVALNISGSVTSSVNFVASGFGVDDGVAVATLAIVRRLSSSRPARPADPGVADRRASPAVVTPPAYDAGT